MSGVTRARVDELPVRRHFVLRAVTPPLWTATEDMLDPTIVLDLQRAVSLPAFTPPAIVRAWKSPFAERAERAVAPILDDAERQTHAWRMKVMELEAIIPSVMLNVWTDDDLADIDSTIRVGERTVADQLRKSRRQAEKTSKLNRRLAVKDKSAAESHRRQSAELRALNDANIDILKALIERLRVLRAKVDTRSGAEPGFVWHSWDPNARTMAAIADAEAGRLEEVTLDDLRAELLADD